MIILAGTLPNSQEPGCDFIAHVDGAAFTIVQVDGEPPDVWQGIENHPGDVVPLYSGLTANTFIRQVLDAWAFQLRQYQYSSPVSPGISQAVSDYVGASSTP